MPQPTVTDLKTLRPLEALTLLGMLQPQALVFLNRLVTLVSASSKVTYYFI